MAKKDRDDDLLNVYAYLRHQMDVLTTDMKSDAQQLQKNEDALNQRDQALEDLIQRMRRLGVPEEMLAQLDVDHEEYLEPAPEVTINLPENINWQQKFNEYVEKAASEGFVNVSIEELLTPEEMASAEQRNQKTDQLFSAATELNGWDMLVVSIGVLLHLLRYILFQAKLDKDAAASIANEAAQSFSGPPSPEAASDGSWLPSGPGQCPPEAGSASQPNASEPVSSIQQVLGMLPFQRKVQIRDVDSILADTPSFRQIHDQRYTDEQSFLGNDLLWGWIVGVFNIMTDTVTTRGMHTFQPMPGTDYTHLTLSQENLPFYDLFIPFADRGLDGLQDQVIASTIREAYVLLPNESDFSNVTDLFRQSRDAMDTTNTALSALPDSPLLSVGTVLQSAGWSNLVNILLIAVHNLFYRQDMNRKQYMVRTMKVITLANTIGSSLSSMPALLTRNFSDLDYGGIATILQNTAGLTTMMVDAKTEFLVSEYLPQLQSQIQSLDKYFVTGSSSP